MDRYGNEHAGWSLRILTSTSSGVPNGGKVNRDCQMERTAIESRDIQSRTECSGPVFITPSTKGIQTGLLKSNKEKKKKPTIFYNLL